MDLRVMSPTSYQTALPRDMCFANSSAPNEYSALQPSLCALLPNSFLDQRQIAYNVQTAVLSWHHKFFGEGFRNIWGDPSKLFE